MTVFLTILLTVAVAWIAIFQGFPFMQWTVAGTAFTVVVWALTGQWGLCPPINTARAKGD